MGLVRYLFSTKQSSVRSAAFVMMAMVMASRVLGLVRDRMLAARFAPEELGVYLAAFRIPNMLFEILVMGALTAAFIPIFTKFLSTNNERQAWRLSSAIINICTVALVALSVPMLLWTEPISRLITPGFDRSQIRLMSEFTRVIILTQVLPLLIGNFFTGILQSYNIFLIPAAAPVIYNLGTIVGIIAFSSTMGLWAPVYGVGMGAILFAVIQIPSLVAVGFRHYPIWSVKEEGVKDVLKLMIPRTAGLAVSQIDSTVDLILASVLGARMVTVFNFAQHLQQLPVGLFGTTIAQAAFPLLSQASAKKDEGLFLKTMVSAINQMMFFILPITVMFIILRIPIIRIVFGASRYDWDATVMTGATLSTFAVSMFAQALSQILTRASYALYDSMMPVTVGIATIICNTVLSILFVQILHYPVWYLGVSTSIASIINMTVMAVMLKRRMPALRLWLMMSGPLRMLAASILMGVAMYVPLKLFDELVFDTTRTFGLMLLTVFSAGTGVLCYLFFVWALDVSEAKAFIVMFDRIRQGRRLIMEPANEVVSNGTQEGSLT